MSSYKKKKNMKDSVRGGLIVTLSTRRLFYLFKAPVIADLSTNRKVSGFIPDSANLVYE